MFYHEVFSELGEMRKQGLTTDDLLHESHAIGQARVDSLRYFDGNRVAHYDVDIMLGCDLDYSLGESDPESDVTLSMIVRR
jgi:hypothetical protein